MFVKHIIKTPTCFGHSCLTIFREPFSVLSAVTTSLDDANKQRSSNSTKHGKRPPEDGQTRVTETCRVFNDVIYKHF